MVFRALTFAGSRSKKVFEHEPAGRVFKHLPRDPANVNAQNNMADRYSCINLLYSFALSDP